MNKRLNLGLGKGKGYYNLIPRYDSYIHSLSAKGIKTYEIKSKYWAKKINREEAQKIAEAQGSDFVGTLDEVWEHAKKKHGIKGTMKNARLDGSVFADDRWYQEKMILTNEKGEYWFVCLEGVVSQ